jgi:hypothetical protein
MRFLTEMGNPLPKAFKDAAEFILNTDLRRALDADEIDVPRIKSLVATAHTWGSELDSEGHGYLLQKTLTCMMRGVFDNPDDEALLERLSVAVRMADSLPFPLDLGQVQTLYYRMLPTARAERKAQAEAGDEAAKAWLERFDVLGELLKVRAE